MSTYFDPPVFIEHGSALRLLPTDQYPYLCNDQGRGRQSKQPQGRLIELVPDDPTLAKGNAYPVLSHRRARVPDADYEVTWFDFGQHEVRYQGLHATRDNAHAFGMTLLKSGECLRFQYEGLAMAHFNYGKWAGHQSPYLEPQRRRELLTVNPTDLEFHAFPHVFFSSDSLPLVISVARWWPYAGTITLADLWLAPGDALVLPPQIMPPQPTGSVELAPSRTLAINLHGNRNAALACWGIDSVATVSTVTILVDDEARKLPVNAPHYFAEPAPTLHLRPLLAE